ncbi:hypothetical protein ACKI1J_12400 [Streptomyces scabiei]|uniref:hypothetical protein n=1 Tax=Streptomyces scabiei TaxID=1930 RepID=UPI0038F80D5F
MFGERRVPDVEVMGRRRGDGQQALAAVEAHSPDVLLTDLRMPPLETAAKPPSRPTPNRVFAGTGCRDRGRSSTYAHHRGLA